jgi:hypothetical protein
MENRSAATIPDGAHTDLAMMRCRISHIQRVPPTPAAAAVLRGTPTTLLHIDRKLAISLLGTGAIEGAERDAALALSALTAVSDRASEARVKAHEALIAAIAEGQQDRRRHQQQLLQQQRR